MTEKSELFSIEVSLPPKPWRRVGRPYESREYAEMWADIVRKTYPNLQVRVVPEREEVA